MPEKSRFTAKDPGEGVRNEPLSWIARNGECADAQVAHRRTRMRMSARMRFFGCDTNSFCDATIQVFDGR